MKTLIVADVHLKVTPAGRDSLLEFAAFLSSLDARAYERIIVLGDLFDFWFEYRHVIFSDYFPVLRAFAGLKDAGVDLHLVCGNHDFWAGRFLRDFLGFTIHADRLEHSFGGKRALLVHGDGVNAEDWRYRIYKRIARSRWPVFLFSLLHPDWAMNLGSAVSHGSRALFMPSDPSKGREVKPLERFAKGILARGEADVVICGHSHYPVIEEAPTPSGTGLYINTGDWMFHKTYIEWDGETFQRCWHGREESGSALSVKLPGATI